MIDVQQKAKHKISQYDPRGPRLYVKFKNSRISYHCYFGDVTAASKFKKYASIQYTFMVEESKHSAQSDRPALLGCQRCLANAKTQILPSAIQEIHDTWAKF